MRRRCGCSGHGMHGPHRCEEMGFSMGDFLTAVVLNELSKGDMHGYELYERVLNLEYYPFKHDQSVLYSLLRKLNNHGLVEYRIEEGSGAPRKVYSITETGKEYLKELRIYIQKLKESFEAFLKS